MSIFGLIEYPTPARKCAPSTTTSWRRARPTGSTISGKRIAHDPVMLKRTWETSSRSWRPGALDPLTKEMIYVAVSVTNQCEYCIATHTASAKNKGMTDAQFKELMSVVGMANETNRLVAGYQVEMDERFKPPLAIETGLSRVSSVQTGQKLAGTSRPQQCSQSHTRLERSCL